MEIFYNLLYLFFIQTAEKDEYEYQQKELEKIAMPIMTKLAQSGGAPGN